ncbi:MAG TPA: FG-GAP-like repeat-containing protein [Candidatus Eisenbacteria bacterium]|jgi:hypothetical protein
MSSRIRFRLTPAIATSLWALAATVLLSSSASALSSRTLLTSTGSGLSQRLGQAVASAGDFNGDGRLDVLVGAPGVSSGSGLVLLYLGADLNATPLSFVGAASESSGYSVAPAGDFNGDGYADIIVGAPGNDTGGTSRGQAYLFLGGPVPNLVSDLTFSGEAAADQFGWSVAGGRDLNGDGFDDIVIGAPSNDAGGSANNIGRAYVFLGSATPNATADATFTGLAANDAFGSSVAVGGDLNRDGYFDIFVGAPLNDAAAVDAGAAYVFHGGPGINSLADVTLVGAVTLDHFGTSVAWVGDMNGDGDVDIICGAPDNDNAGAGAGAAYVYVGGPDMDTIADLTLLGTLAGDLLGGAVSAAGDVNGDGYADALVGARLAGSTSNNDGLAYLYLGGPSPNATADLILSPPPEAEGFGTAVAAAGDMDRDGYDDVLVGDPQDVTAGSNAGRAYLYAIYPYQIVTPTGGDVWPEHGKVAVMWRGHDPADLELSLDAGLTFEKLAASQGGLDVNVETLDVPEGLELEVPDSDNRAMIRLTFMGQTPTRGNSVMSRPFRLVHYPRPISVASKVELTLSAPTPQDTVRAVASADLDRDGIEDLILGRPGSNSGAGKVEVYFGATHDASGTPKYQTPPVTVALGATGDAFGWAIATGDMNGDCIQDIAIGSPKADPSSMADAGKTTVIFGDGVHGSIPPTGHLTVTGTVAGDQLGYAVAIVKDMNGDDFADLAAGAPFSDTPSADAGQVRIYYGASAPDATSDININGEAGGDNFGFSLAAMPDPDSPVDWCELFPWLCPVISGALLVGSPFNDVAASNAGAAYLYAGGRSVDGVAELTMRGASGEAHFGMAVANIGDFNGDQICDFAIGAPGGDCFDPPCPPDGGLVYVRLFDPRCFVIDPWPPQPDPWFMVVEGEATGDLYGLNLAGTDMNHDGLSDLVVTAPFHDNAAGADAGRLYSYWGRAAKPAEFSPAGGVIPDFVTDGAAANERLGQVLGVIDAVGTHVGPPELPTASASPASLGAEPGLADGVRVGPKPAADPALIRRRCYLKSFGSQPGAGSTAGSFGTVGASRQPGMMIPVSPPEAPPPPMLGGDLLVGNGGSAPVLRLYDINRYHLLGPVEAAVWSAGSQQRVSWTGSGPVAIQLSADGGASFGTIATSSGGSATNAATVRVPDLPTGLGLLRIIPWPPCPPCPGCLTCPPWIGFDLSDPFQIVRYPRPPAVAAEVGLTLPASATQDTVRAVQSADVNGDGIEDLITGAPFAGSGAGRVKIYLGTDRTASGRPKFNSAPITLAPTANPDAFGWSLATGDVNGDCIPDVAVGAPRADPSTLTDAGRAYVFFGGASMDATPDWVVDGGIAGEQLGYAVALVEDMNGDDHADLAAGAPESNVSGTGSGRVRVYYGGTAPDATSDLDLNGQAAGDKLGTSLAALPDPDGGIDWCEIFPWLCPVISGGLAAGAPFSDGAANNAGAVYLYAGGLGADAIADDILRGDQADAHFGLTLASIGDFNGDRLSDLAVGAPDEDGFYPSVICPDMGRVYVRVIDPRCFVIDPWPDPWPGPWFQVLDGEAANDHFGSKVEGADLNHDGLNDLVVSAPEHDGAFGSDAGRIYAYFGHVAAPVSPPESPAGDVHIVDPEWLVDGAAASEGLGEVLGVTEAVAHPVSPPDVAIPVAPPDRALPSSAAAPALIRTRCRFYNYAAAPDPAAGTSRVGTAGRRPGMTGTNDQPVQPPDAPPPPMLGGDLLIGRLGTAPELRLYDANRYQLTSPIGSATWNVGSLQKISWKGSDPAAIQLSVNGGASYTTIAQSPGGKAVNAMNVRVPHLPTRFGYLRIIPWPPCPPCPGCLTCPPWVGFAQTDTFVTIQSSVSLLSFSAKLGDSGAELSWSTNPGIGPDGLTGYRLYRFEPGTTGQGSRIGPETIAEDRYIDAQGGPGTSYRLAAVNGLGEELELGQTSLDAALAGLRTWPSPVSGRSALTVSLGAPWVAPGVAATDLDVGVFDLGGRRVATLASGYVQPKSGLVHFEWRLADRSGNAVHPGLYFVRAAAPSAYLRMERKVVVTP